MKELIKVETLRSKLPDNYRPTKYKFMEFMGVGTHRIKPSTIDKIKAILERDHANNMAWLEGRKSKYIHPPISK